MDKYQAQYYYSIISDMDSVYELSKDDYEFFQQHSLHFFINSLVNLTIPFSEEERTKKIIIGEMSYQQRLYELSIIANAFNTNNIDFRVLKGIGIALTYPYPATRLMSDFDILVRLEDHLAATEILKTLGYRCDYYDTIKVDLPFFKERAMNLELHSSLFSEKENKILSSLSEEIWTESESVFLFDIPIKLPIPYVHLKYQIFHMIKHFKSRGSGLRFLLDLRYFTRYHNLSLINLIPYFNESGFEVFYHSLLEVMNNYMDYNFDEDFYRKDDSVELNEWMAEYILENGTYGNRDPESSMDFRFYKYKKIAKKSIWETIRVILFPNKNELDTHFSYAKKNSLLVPIAWIHRMCYALFSNKYTLKEKGFIFTKNKSEINKRIELMKRLDLL